MSNRKILLLSLILPFTLLLGAIRLLLKGQDMSEIAAFFGLLCLVPWAIIILTGMAIRRLIRKPATQTIVYISLQVLLLSVIPAIMLVDKYKSYRHQRDYGNIDDNHWLIGLGSERSDPPDNKHIRMAFARLEAAFKDPNSFRLEQVFHRYRDSIYYVVFQYSFESSNRYARVRIAGDSAVLDAFNEPWAGAEIRQLDSVSSVNRKKDIEALEEALPQMPDSESRGIVDTMLHRLRENTN